MEKIRLKILLALFALAFVLVSFVTFTERHFYVLDIEQREQHNQQLTEKQILNDLQMVDQAYYGHYLSTTKQMEMTLRTMVEQYEKHKNIALFDFNKLKQNNNIDIFIIDNQNTIVRTTFKRDLGLNFNTCCQKFAKELNTYRETGAFVSTDAVISYNTGSMYKYSYLATPDKQYIFQLGLNISEDPLIKQFDFEQVIQTLVSEYDSVQNIQLLTNYGTFLQKTDSSLKVSGMPKQFQQAYNKALKTLKPVQYEVKLENGVTEQHKLIPYNSKNGDLERQRVIYIQFDNQLKQAFLYKVNLRYIELLFASLIVSLVTLFLIMKALKSTFYHAANDPLTGLQNRLAFSKLVEAKFRKLHPLGLILISVDHFKEINNKYSEKNGDEFLKAIAQYLKEVSPKESVYRFTGDEFAILFKDGYDDPAIAKLVYDIQQRFTQNWEANQLSTRISATIAVIDVPRLAQTKKEMISILEYCIHHSKQTRSGGIVFVDESIVSKLGRKRQIAEALKDAATRGCYEVHYQPIYSIEEGRFQSAEALIRFNDDVLGFVSPTEFIPIAEEAGYIYDIFYFVLNDACKVLEQLNKTLNYQMSISINCSAIQLSEKNLVEKISNTIYQYDIIPNQIRLEITESAFIDDTEHVSQIMSELKTLGIEFYLDDFGTGYSSLSTVMQLPFTYIKIDRSILNEATRSVKAYNILQAMVDTFYKNDLQIVVEGIENEEHEGLVRKTKSGYIQGFFFARPMKTESFLETIQNQSVKITKEI